MTVKIAVSLPDELVAQAKAAVAAGQAASVSAYVADALREKGSRRTLDAWLAEEETELGPITDEERAWADYVLEHGNVSSVRRPRSWASRGSAWTLGL
jgi:Arc/MetJ-type ribon-helix-helix transcriptional regulator